jgi:arylsulfatase A-like enzyme
VPVVNRFGNSRASHERTQQEHIVNLRNPLALSLCSVLLWLPKPGGTAWGDDRPNLLVIHTDEHNFRTLGCYRALLPDDQAFIWGKDSVVTTPNIDWIAARGAISTSFYATTPVCSPSRAAFVSGRYPQNTPVVTNNIPISDEIVTFAEILRREGYATGYAGKWHLDGTGKPQWAPERKFGFQDNRYMFNRGHWKQLEDAAEGPRVKARSAVGAPSYSVAGADEESFTTDFLAGRTVAFMAAHNVGKILEALRSHGLIGNTIVVFTADHGDLRGEHHRQNKGVPYEGSARIPFILHYPGTGRSTKTPEPGTARSGPT